jgi:hypothetical protein
MDQHTIRKVRSVGFLIMGLLLFISALRENKPYIIYDYVKYAVSLFMIGYAIWNFVATMNDDESSSK